MAEHSLAGFLKRGLSFPDYCSGSRLGQRTGLVLERLPSHRSHPALTCLRVSMFDRVSVLVMVNYPAAASRWHQGCSGGQTCARLEAQLGTSAAGFAFQPQYSPGCLLDLVR